MKSKKDDASTAWWLVVIRRLSSARLNNAAGMHIVHVADRLHNRCLRTKSIACVGQVRARIHS